MDINVSPHSTEIVRNILTLIITNKPINLTEHERTEIIQFITDISDELDNEAERQYMERHYSGA